LTTLLADDGAVYVRYMVDDIAAAADFYVKHLGFELHWSAGTAFAEIARGNLHLLLSGAASSAARPMPDGRQPGRAAGTAFTCSSTTSRARSSGSGRRASPSGARS
jgi:catechol 2,3-dioxygenase-like lactoylglutathione lyase family enzyme